MQGTNPSRELTNKKTDIPSREPTLTRERNQGNQPFTRERNQGNQPFTQGNQGIILQCNFEEGIQARTLLTCS